MIRARPGAGRRLRALAYTGVTTATVLLFALAEWATESFVAVLNRTASIAIAIGIVLVLALVVRPLHHAVEEAIDAAFYRRRRQAIAALENVRHELTTYRNMNELLHRVMEAVERYGEARACAVYLNRDLFRLEGTSFDHAIAEIGEEDPLIRRFRSSSKPAHPKQLESAAPGTHAFPMNAAGELVGFLAVDSHHDAYDAEEISALADLAKDLALAVAAIDPVIRLNRNRVPHNLPAGLVDMIGRDREIDEICTALLETRMLTLTGPGGVGKTRVALAIASIELSRHEQGVWFVDLAPIRSGDLVAATILSALGVGTSEDGTERAKLVEYLSARDLVVVLDNCEHLLPSVAAIASEILNQCASVVVIATSREMLHVAGERVYRLDPLAPDAAVRLFLERATSVTPSLDPDANASVIAEICERLDGVPLAIELAAARIRVLSPREILDRLDERFRLLTGGDRAALARHQTLSATIAWSYDLLAAEEKTLFERMATFRGSFSLHAATALCQENGERDEYHVLDLVTSLLDKSLLTVAPGPSTRYRQLETIRAFAATRSLEAQAFAIARERHARYFSDTAAHAYHEFDTKLPEGWLARLSPDIDNFRAALEWTLEGDGDRLTGAQLAADSGPVFLRMGLLAEGLRWCDRALGIDGIPDETAGRLQYGAATMYVNLAAHAKALVCSERAVSHFRKANDRRGLVRALSQVAQQLAKLQRFAQAEKPAQEAVEMARHLGEPRMLATVLRRLAFSLPPQQIVEARQLFEEALAVSRAAGEREEQCFALMWWAVREADIEAYDAAIQLSKDGLKVADGSNRQYLLVNIAECAVLAGRGREAEPYAREALRLAREEHNEVLIALAVAFAAPGHASVAASDAALAFGYAQARLAELSFEADDGDIRALLGASLFVERALAGIPMQPLLDRGAALRIEQVIELLAQGLTSDDAGSVATNSARDRVGTLLG